MSNYRTPDEAKNEVFCPIARTFGEKAKMTNTCVGEKCALWRWKPRLVSDPGFVSAIAREMHNLALEYNEANEKKKTPEHFRKEATSAVVRNPEGFGIERDQGFCGLGGPVT